MRTFLIKPFVENLSFLVILVEFICTPCFLYHSFMSFEGIGAIVWECAHCYLLCYFVVLLVPVHPSWLARVYKITFCTLAFLDFCIEASCLITTSVPFSREFVDIILGTNLSETSEFIKQYFSLKLILFIITILGIGAAIVALKEKIIIKRGWVVYILSLFTILSAIYFGVIKKSNSWDCKFYCKVYPFLSYQRPPDLRMYKSNVNVQCDSQLPQNIIIIIGESFAKSHSSLYGYSKNTNPNLTELVEDSLLVVYSNAVASALNTIPNIKSIMSTWQANHAETQEDWYRCETLIEIMKELEYNTIWVSNQSPTGLSDNVAACYAKLCDYYYFVGGKYEGVYKKDYDGLILELMESSSVTYAEKNFIVFHLMGSHVAYGDRYPTEYNNFSEDHYSDISRKYAKVLAQYDNSVLYNDFIVSEIFQYFDSQETLGFYFSDHGLDLFESSKDYYGYGIGNNDKSIAAATAIPFFVYTSSQFKEKFPDVNKSIRERCDMSINNGMMINFLCELLNIYIRNEGDEY